VLLGLICFIQYAAQSNYIIMRDVSVGGDWTAGCLLCLSARRFSNKLYIIFIKIGPKRNRCFLFSSCLRVLDDKKHFIRITGVEI